MLKLGILLFLFLIQVVCGSEVHSPPRLVTRLIHFDSIQSPFYNPKYINDDLAEIDLHGSSWHVFLHSSQHFGTMSTPVYPLRKSAFLVHLKVGQHKDDQYLFLDTGSSLLWIHCRPDSLNARNPVYDSKKSSTYQAEDCRTSAFCDAYNFKCDIFHRCRYIQSYADGIKSKGHLARETFVFGGTSGSLFGKNEVVLHGIVFGCSNATRLRSDGVLGFGNSTHSLLAQTSSSRFSYCLGDINDLGYKYNILIIGNPMKERLTHEITLIVDGKYYIDITAIQIGRVILDIETDILKRNRYEHTGGMAVDTGSTLSFFPEVVYYPFAAAIRKLIDDLSLDRYYHDSAMLCYNGNFRRDLAEFPIVRFWLGKISYMEFRTGHLFQQMRDEIFCLAFKPSEDVNENFDFGIMGILLQQGYYISYNLQASTFSFESMDCSAFDNDIHDEL